MTCACARLAPATTTSANIAAIVLNHFFITLFSLIRVYSVVFYGSLRFPTIAGVLGARDQISDHFYYCSRAERAAMAAPCLSRDRPTFVTDAAAAYGAVRSAVKSNESERSSLSQRPAVDDAW